MTRLRPGLALAALALPLWLAPSAYADPAINNCTTSGTINAFTLACTGANGNNHNSGTYTLNVAWSLPPCTALPGTAVTGVLSGTVPGGTVTSGQALTLITTNTVFDISLGYGVSPSHGGMNRHSALLQYTCPTGTLLPNAQVSDLDVISQIPSQPDSAYCPSALMSGAATVTPAMGDIGSQTITLSLSFTCLGAVGSDSAGNYTLTLSGKDIGGCISGNGSGVISGSGGENNLPVSGAWMYSRSTLHFYGFTPSGTGFITMGGHTYQFYLWLDIVPASSCQYVAGQMTGHGLVVA